jgi:hypothetical protein
MAGVGECLPALSAPSLIPKDQARQDVDFLFRVLRYGYGAYQCFGGDEAFLAAEEGILADIDAIRGANVMSSQFAAILQRRLGFIQDGHFSIAGRTMCHRYQPFARFDMEFDERDGRFYARRTPDLWAVSVEGEDPARSCGRHSSGGYAILDAAA